MNFTGQEIGDSGLAISLWGGHDRLICGQLGPKTALLEVKESNGVDSSGDGCPICCNRRDAGLTFEINLSPTLYPSALAKEIHTATQLLLRGDGSGSPQPESIVVVSDHRAIGVSAQLAVEFGLAFVGAIAAVYDDRVATTNFDSGATFYLRSGSSGYVITPLDTAHRRSSSAIGTHPHLTREHRRDDQDSTSNDFGGSADAPIETEVTPFAHKSERDSSDSFPNYQVIGATKDGGSLSSSEIVLVVGGGLKSADSIEKIITLAEKLEIAYGATRVICDAGYTDHSRQIGTTGVTISPKLYIALGVSGQPQHLGGLENLGEGMSFNTDKGAPINTFVDSAYISDAQEVLEHLFKKVMELDGQ